MYLLSHDWHLFLPLTTITTLYFLLMFLLILLFNKASKPFDFLIIYLKISWIMWDDVC